MKIQEIKISDIKFRDNVRALKQIDKDYKELSFNDQKNIDIVLAEIFMVELLNISNPISLIGDIGPIKS